MAYGRSANLRKSSRLLFVCIIGEECSAAEKAGLQTYDRIIEFNGAEINDYNDLSQALEELDVGDTAAIKVIRNNEELELSITLQENTQSNN